ncbi:hypothetical protein LCGC14_3026280, partial [marine sediment metagenome]
IGIGPTLAVDAGGAYTYYASPGFYKEQLCLGATCVTRTVQVAPDLLTEVTINTLNNVVYANAQAGADAGFKIAACLAALPSTGGTCDARGLEGAQAISATVTVPTKVKLLLGAATFTGSVLPVFEVNSGSSIVGLGMGFTNTDASTRIVTNLTSGSVIVSENIAGATDMVTIRDLQIDNTSSSNAGAIGLDLIAAGMWRVERIRLNRIETAIRVGGSGSCACYNHFYSIQVIDAVTGVNFSTTANSNTWTGGLIGSTVDSGRAFQFSATASGNILFHPDVETFPNGIAFDFQLNSGSQTIYAPYVESGGTVFNIADLAGSSSGIFVSGGTIFSISTLLNNPTNERFVFLDATSGWTTNE